MKNLIIGLLAAMLANILLGGSLALFKKEFSWKKLFSGVFKASCIALGCFLMYVVSFYNSDIFVANINGTNVNLISGMKAIFVAGIILYGYQDLNKLQKIIKTDISIDNVKEDEITVIERDDL